MIKVGERSIVVTIAGVVSPLWFVLLLFIQLHVFLNHAVWRCFSVVEVSEWTIVVRVARIVAPFWFVFLRQLNVLLDYTIRGSLSMVEVSKWSIVVAVSTIVSPLWLVLHSLKVFKVVVLGFHCSRTQE